MAFRLEDHLKDEDRIEAFRRAVAGFADPLFSARAERLIRAAEIRRTPLHPEERRSAARHEGQPEAAPTSPLADRLPVDDILFDDFACRAARNQLARS